MASRARKVSGAFANSRNGPLALRTSQGKGTLSISIWLWGVPGCCPINFVYSIDGLLGKYVIICKCFCCYSVFQLSVESLVLLTCVRFEIG